MAEPIGVEVPFAVVLAAYKERCAQLTDENVQLRAMLTHLHAMAPVSGAALGAAPSGPPPEA